MGCSGSKSNKNKGQNQLLQEDNDNKQREGQIKITAGNFVDGQDGANIKDIYNMKEVLGEGQFGKVRKVEHKKTQEKRALKQIEKKKLSEEEQKKLINEVEILKSLDHPFIMKIMEFFNDKRNFYIITELFTGKELFDKIIDMGSFDEGEAARIFQQLLQAINYSHKQGFMHRDLKPENILLDLVGKTYNIKVIDWGCSCAFKKGEKQNTLIGTPYYIAPEIAIYNFTKEAQKSTLPGYDEKVDIWSCGVILYILLTGEPPFNSNSPHNAENEIMRKTFTENHNYNSEAASAISLEAKELINQMLQKKPEKRPTAEQCLQHNWFKVVHKPKELDQQIAKHNLERLKNFQVKSELHKAVFTFIAARLISKDESERLRQLFSSLDKDGDGTISKQELIEGYKKMMSDMTDEEIQQQVNTVIANVDSDLGGTINYTEFLAATMNHKEYLSENKLKKAFDAFDVDGSGDIENAELAKILGIELTDSKNKEIWQRLIEEADENKDGKIQFNEFVSLMKNFSQKKAD